MAEEFPRYRHEDDDDTPADREERLPAPPPVPERHAPVQQEGTIFSRGEVAPHLSRPLFDFIRKQEQPKAQVPEASKSPEQPSKEVLPSVAHPEDPEVHTYRPPVDPEIAAAARTAEAAQAAAHTAESGRPVSPEDDDDDEAEDTTAAPPQQPAATRPPAASAPAERQPDAQRSLNEQFEEIIRSEMGDDFAALTSGDQLAPSQNRASREETAGSRDVEIVDRDAAGNATGHRVVDVEPSVRPNHSAFAPVEVDPLDDIDESAPIDYGMPIPDGVTKSGVFYYNENPDPVAAGASTGTRAAGRRGWRRGSGPAYAATTGGGGTGYTPTGTAAAPTPETPSSPHTPEDPDDPLTPVPPIHYHAAAAPPPPPRRPIASTAAALSPKSLRPRTERREGHNARWFIAGFITGWAVKQHLANKKAAHVQKAHNHELNEQNQQFSALELQKRAAARDLQKTQGELMQTRADAAAKATEDERQGFRDEADARFQRRQEQRAAAQPQAEVTPAEQAHSNGDALATEAGTSATAAAEAASPTALAGQPAASPARAPGGEQQAFAGSGPLQAAEALVAAPFAAAGRAESPGLSGPAAAVQPSALQEHARPAPTPQEAAQEAVARAFGLAPGQRIEHAAGGGHDIVVDSHGHEVQGARVYGEEFRAQQRQEQPGSASGSADGHAQEAVVEVQVSAAPGQRPRKGQTDARRGIVSGLGGGTGMLGSGLADARHEIGVGAAAARKRITANIPGKNENPLVATLASPWLWASVFVLIAAFFLAAFI